MKYLLLAFLLAPSFSWAETTGMTSSDKKPDMTVKEFISRLQINGELFVFSADGKRLLYRISESSSGEPGENSSSIVANWGHEQNTGDKIIPICLREEFHVGEDGTLKAHIQQFEAMKPNQLKGTVDYGKLIREENFEIKDFSPITWVAYSDAKQRIVARITPVIKDRGQIFEPAELPIYLENAVLTDSTGKVWAEDMSEGGGKYVSLATYKGTLALSFFAFPGANEIGFAEGNKIELKDVKPSLTLQSEKPFISAHGRMKVYGLVLPDQKTERLHSVHMSVSDKEKEFLNSLK